MKLRLITFPILVANTLTVLNKLDKLLLCMFLHALFNLIKEN